MNFLKRALLSTVRKKGKSIILLVVIFILGNLMAGSIAVKQATTNVEKTIKAKLGAQATIEIDWESIDWSAMEEGAQLPKLDQKTVDKIGKLDGIKYYEYNLTTYAYSKEYEAYCGPECEMEGNEEGIGFELYGVQLPSIADIEENKIALSDGRVFKQEEIDQAKPVALVSTLFAEMNNLHIGDTITFDMNVFKWNEEEINHTDQPPIVSTKAYPYEIIGIFDASLSINEDDAQTQGYVDYSMTQRIYIPNSCVSIMNEWMVEEENKHNDYDFELSDVQSIMPKYYLKDVEQLSSFKEAATKLIPEGYIVNISSDAYDSVAGPISFISWLAGGILYISIAATILILGLVVILFLRDRRHEFGIYLSIGVRKWKIVSQVVIEVLVVGVIALTLSLFSGKELANGVSQKMIDQQVINSNNNGMIYYAAMPGGSGGNVNQNEVLDTYEVTLDADYILMLYIVGLGTLLISSVAPTVYVVRLKPRKVLM